MKLPTDNLGFSEEELVRRKQLGDLFDVWTKRLEEAGVANGSLEKFVADGFYPGFMSQKHKLLFIGRESLCMTGLDMIEVIYGAYHEKTVGGQALNRCRFHAMQMYITYALEHGVHDYSRIPYADKIADTFGMPGGISNAFMNISKFSNDNWWYNKNSRKGWVADWKLIDEFVCGSRGEPNLFNREIEIIAPDAIVTMNLGGYLKELGPLERFRDEGDSNVSVYELKVGSRKIPLFDVWHFSSPGKNQRRDLFDPLVAAISGRLDVQCE